VVATSQLARKVLQGWRPSVVVWRIVVPTLEDISLAREIRHSIVDPPHIVYLHRDCDVVLLPAELELLFA
jgi:hypothetical protein